MNNDRSICYEIWQTYVTVDEDGLRNAFLGCSADDEFDRKYSIYDGNNCSKYKSSEEYVTDFNGDEQELAEWSVDSDYSLCGHIVVYANDTAIDICESSLWKYEYIDSDPVYWEHIYQGRGFNVFTGCNPPMHFNTFEEAKEHALKYCEERRTS